MYSFHAQPSGGLESFCIPRQSALFFLTVPSYGSVVEIFILVVFDFSLVWQRGRAVVDKLLARWRATRSIQSSGIVAGQQGDVWLGGNGTRSTLSLFIPRADYLAPFSVGTYLKQ